MIIIILTSVSRIVICSWIWILIYYVFVCSSATVAFLISCGPVDWFTDTKPLTPTNRTHSDNIVLSTSVPELQQKSVICHTSSADVLSKWRHTPHIFTAQIHNKSFIYLSGNREINGQILEHFISHPCGFVYKDFIHYCCVYSSHYSESKTEKFTFQKQYITDPYFHVEDIFYGKPQHVELRVQFTHVTTEFEEITITAEHKCRSDVVFDPYPEIHISVDTMSSKNGVSQSKFHWYL